jgi:hypothetical protein
MPLIMDSNEVHDAVVDAFEACLSAQLKAVRALRSRRHPPDRTRETPGAGRTRAKGMSQIEMAHDILKSARRPLHASEIIERIASRFGLSVDRESLVSALSKRVVRKDRFVRTAKNTFGLIESASEHGLSK